jgi:hypothetical protein
MMIRTAVLRLADTKQRRQVRTMQELVELLEDSGFRPRSQERFRASLWGLMCVVARTPEVPTGVSALNEHPLRVSRSGVRLHA